MKMDEDGVEGGLASQLYIPVDDGRLNESLPLGRPW